MKEDVLEAWHKLQHLMHQEEEALALLPAQEGAQQRQQLQQGQVVGVSAPAADGQAAAGGIGAGLSAHGAAAGSGLPAPASAAGQQHQQQQDSNMCPICMDECTVRDLDAALMVPAICSL